MLGVDALIVAGGAQAIGALAFGLPDAVVDPVDLIVGPGNAWVTAAKIEVTAIVGIDLPAGPSEGIVLADASADPALVAADLVTQAEHGPDSPAILVTTDAALADSVEREVAALLPTARARARSSPRRSTIMAGSCSRRILRRRSTSSTATRRNTSRSTSPTRSGRRPDPQRRLDLRRTVGPESAGDYATGANHVLPTGGLARSSGRCPSRCSAGSARSNGSTATGSPRSRPRSGRSRRPRA